MSPWSKRETLLVHAGIGLVVAALFFHVLLLGDTWFLRDALSIHKVWRGHVLDELAAWRLPEWWDAVGLGTPVAGNPLFGALYPPTWPLALLPAGFAVDLSFALHVWLAGAGVARLARRLGAGPLGAFVGGASFAAGGWATSMVVMGVPLLTAAWTPHIVAAGDAAARAEGRAWRPAIVLSGFWAMQLLAGDPAAAISTLPLVAIVVLLRARRRLAALARVAAAGAAALPLAALVLLPALAYLGDSERAAGVSAASASDWSMHPLRMVEWIWPRFLGDSTDAHLHLARLIADTGWRDGLEAQFTPNPFVGLPVLVLAAFAARRRELVWIGGAATLLFVLLALGEHTPFYAAWRAVVWPERFVRYPERHILPALVVWSALAGVGFGEAMRSRGAAFAMAAAALGLTGMVFAAWLARGRLEAWLGGLHTASGSPVLVDRAVSMALSSGAVAAGFAWLLAAVLYLAGRRRLARLTPGLLAVLIVGQLWGADAAYLPTISRQSAHQLPAWLAGPLSGDVADHARGAAIGRVYRDVVLGHVAAELAPAEIAVTSHLSLSDHTLPSSGLAEVPGYHTTEPARQQRLWQAATAAPFERLLDLFDVHWAILSDGDARIGAWPQKARVQTLYGLYENPARRPRAFVAPRWTWAADPRAALAALLAAGLDFHAVRLEGQGEPPRPEAAAASLTPCELTTPRPERVTIRCTSPTGGFAVLLDAWSPGWSATLDGVPADAVRAEAVARAVRIGPGSHVVEWRYRTPRMLLGAGVSGVAWILWIVGCWVTRRQLPASPRSRSP